MSYQYSTLPGKRTIRYLSLDGTPQGESSETMLDFNFFSEVKTDPVRRRRPTGWMYPTEYHLDVSLFRGGYGTYLVYMKDPFPGWYMQFNGAIHAVRNSYPQMNLLPYGNHVDKAVLKTLLNVKGQKVNLGVAFAEAQKTANLVADTAVRLANAYRACKKGRVRDALRFLGVGRVSQLPRTWLEMQYGWLPLLSDVHGSVQELLNKDPKLFRITGKGQSAEQIDDNLNIQVGDHAFLSIRGHRRVSAKVRLDYLPVDIEKITAARLGITNPAEIAWEVVPFSFVVDWFLPIGDVLSALDATSGMRFISGSVTTYNVVDHKIGPGYDNAYAGSTFQHGSFSARRKTLSVHRAVYADSPFPSMPRLNKSPLSLKRVTNGLALLAQAVK